MAHYEFNGTLGVCLGKIDKYIGLKDLDKKAKIVIDIQNEKEVRSQVVRTQPDAAKKP